MSTTTATEPTTTTATKGNDMTTTTTTEPSTTTTTATDYVPLSKDGAERVTKELRKHGKALVTARLQFAKALTTAKEGHAHVALGLPSWPAYVEYVLDNVKGLGKGDREYLGGLMAGEGMSSRAIARTLGVSQSTANRMVKAMTPPDETREVIGSDGVKQASAGEKKANARKGKGKGKTATPKTATTETATPKTATTETVTTETVTPKTATTETATVETATVETATPKTATVETATPKTATVALVATEDGYDVTSLRVSDLLEVALSIVGELYDRWEDGSAESEEAYLAIKDSMHLAE